MSVDGILAEVAWYIPIGAAGVADTGVKCVTASHQPRLAAPFETTAGPTARGWHMVLSILRVRNKQKAGE